MRGPTLPRIALVLVVPAALAAQSADSAALAISGAERSLQLQPGQVLRLEVVGPAGLDTVAGRALGKQVPFYREADGRTWHGLIGVDLDTRPGAYPLTVSATRTGQPGSTAMG